METTRDASAIHRLKGLVGSDDPRERQQAARELVALGEDALPALPMLLEGLKRDGLMARLQCIRAIGAIGPGAASAVSALIELLEEPALRFVAAWALGDLGEVAGSAIARIAWLSDNELAKPPAEMDGQFLAGCGHAFWRTDQNQNRTVALAEQIAELPLPGPKVLAIADLEEIGPLAAHSLRLLLSDPHPAVSAAAAQALAAIEATSATPQLLEALARQSDDDARLAIAVALVQLGDRDELVTATLRALAEPGPHRRRFGDDGQALCGLMLERPQQALDTAREALAAIEVGR